jgi:hypothetical protein
VIKLFVYLESAFVGDPHKFAVRTPQLGETQLRCSLDKYLVLGGAHGVSRKRHSTVVLYCGIWPNKGC